MWAVLLVEFAFRIVFEKSAFAIQLPADSESCEMAALDSHIELMYEGSKVLQHRRSEHDVPLKLFPIFQQSPVRSPAWASILQQPINSIDERICGHLLLLLLHLRIYSAAVESDLVNALSHLSIPSTSPVLP